MSKKAKLNPSDFSGKRYDDLSQLWEDIDRLTDQGHHGWTYDEVRLRGGRLVFDLMTLEAWDKKYPKGLSPEREVINPDQDA